MAYEKHHFKTEFIQRLIIIMKEIIIIIKIKKKKKEKKKLYELCIQKMILSFYIGYVSLLGVNIPQMSKARYMPKKLQERNTNNPDKKIK